MIKQYAKKNGTKAWMFKSYLGIDEMTGKKQWITRRGFASKKECQMALSKAQIDFDKNGAKKQCGETFQEIYEIWFEQYKNTVKESTWAKTKEMFRMHILPRFGATNIDKIKVLACQKAVNEWQQIAPSRTLRFKNYAASVIDFAIALELTEKNPMRKVINPVEKNEFVEDEHLNFYSREELKDFLTKLKELKKPQAYLFFYLLAFTGMRKSEALALTWKDIDFEEGTVNINKTLSLGVKSRLIIVPPKTKKSARRISLDPQTLDLLKEWRKQQKIDFMKLGFNTLKPGQLIFPNGQNKLYQPVKPREWQMKVYQNNPEMKVITTHGFRHTHCSLLFEAGASIKEVQDRLGHTDVKVTMNIYAHVTKKVKDETAKRFANFMEM